MCEREREREQRASVRVCKYRRVFVPKRKRDMSSVTFICNSKVTNDCTCMSTVCAHECEDVHVIVYIWM